MLKVIKLCKLRYRPSYAHFNSLKIVFLYYKFNSINFERWKFLLKYPCPRFLYCPCFKFQATTSTVRIVNASPDVPQCEESWTPVPPRTSNNVNRSFLKSYFNFFSLSFKSYSIVKFNFSRLHIAEPFKSRSRVANYQNFVSTLLALETSWPAIKM